MQSWHLKNSLKYLNTQILAVFGHFIDFVFKTHDLY